MNDSVTVTLPDGVQGSFLLPANAVAYAVYELDREPLPEGSPHGVTKEQALKLSSAPWSARVLIALRTASDSTFYAAYHRARLAYRSLKWIKLPSVRNCNVQSAANAPYYEILVGFDPLSHQLEIHGPADDPMLSAYRPIGDRQAVGVRGKDVLEGLLPGLGQSSELRDLLADEDNEETEQ